MAQRMSEKDCNLTLNSSLTLKEKNIIYSGFRFFVKNLKKSDLLINLVSCFFSLLTTNRVILSEKEV